MKLCLVTGACGFNGLYMVELLVSKGYKVRATDTLQSMKSENYQMIKNLGVEFIPADLTKHTSLIELAKDVEYVFHIAALFSYSALWKNLYKTNVFGTGNLCDALVKYGKVEKFILWSSGSVYGLQKKEYRGRISEYYPNPANLYGKSKLLEEYVALDFLDKYNFPVTIIRCCPIYGPRNTYGLWQVWTAFFKPPVVVLPKKFPLRVPYVHVKDVCNIALYLAENEKRKGNIFNVVDDEDYDVSVLFDLLSRYFNKKILYVPISYKLFILLYKFAAFLFRMLAAVIPIKPFLYLRETIPYATINYRFSNQKIKNFGYKFLYPSIREGLDETLDWLIANGKIKIKKKDAKKEHVIFKKRLS
jgi:nucleoside-diphosphate-sugar epimerase